MATNKTPWQRNLEGAAEPLEVLMPVDAGASYPIKKGEICKVGINTAGRPAPVTAATDVTQLVVAAEEQKSTDVARFIRFQVPRPGDVFEFDLSAARAVVLGETLAISDSQTLAYAVENVIARIASDHNCPEPEEKSVTRRSISHAEVVFDETASYFSELTGNS